MHQSVAPTSRPGAATATASVSEGTSDTTRRARAVQLHRAPEIIPPHRHRHTLRRYCPPTSKNASLIWPSEQCLTASIRAREDVLFARRRLLLEAAQRGRGGLGVPGLKIGQPVQLALLSASLARASSTFAGAARSAPGR